MTKLIMTIATDFKNNPKDNTNLNNKANMKLQTRMT